jgi:protein TonB
VISGYADECEFPPEAREINHALVVVVVDVRKDGTAASVAVKSDPGHGFGRAARTCALGRLYQPARDREGKPTGGPTDPVTVRFLR